MLGYEVWLDGNCLIDSANSETMFEDSEEAYNEASDDVIDKLNDWKAEGTWNGEEFDDFEIKVKEM